MTTLRLVDHTRGRCQTECTRCDERRVRQVNVPHAPACAPFEGLLFGCGIDICKETVRMWWNRIGAMFACDTRRHRM